MKFVIATHNAHKLIELGRILEPLGIAAVTDRDLGLELPEVEETGITFAENAYLKAASARYGGEEATDADRNRLLLAEMQDVPAGQRQARFVSAICCVFPDGRVLRAEGTFEGTIAYAPAGENGFGYDPIFLVGDRTSAEMSPAEKDAVSHRGKALVLFAEKLQNELNSK